MLNIYQGRHPVIGAVLAADNGRSNAMVITKQVKEILPRDLSLKWTVKPLDEKAKQLAFELIAIKVSNRDGRAPLEGDVVTDANTDFDQFTNAAMVNMKMNAEVLNMRHANQREYCNPSLLYWMVMYTPIQQ